LLLLAQTETANTQALVFEQSWHGFNIDSLLPIYLYINYYHTSSLSISHTNTAKASSRKFSAAYIHPRITYHHTWRQNNWPSGARGSVVGRLAPLGQPTPYSAGINWPLAQMLFVMSDEPRAQVLPDPLFFKEALSCF
jgi:hypothetical protein